MILRYFRAVAHSEQMTQTAADLKVAQPALSRAIKKLEEELGQQLFIRHNNRITLNPAGHILLQAVDSMLDTWDGAMEELQLQPGGHSCEVVMNISSAGSSVPMLLREFRKEHPEVAFTIHGQHGQPWEDTVCDVFLFSSAQKLQAPPAVLLCEEQLYLSVSLQHPLAKETSVSLNDCSGLPFLLPDESNDMYNIQIHYCRLAGFTPQTALKVEKQNILINLLTLNQGVSLLPRMSFLEAQRIIQLPIVDIECYRYNHIMLNPRRPYNAAAVQFQQFCIEHYSKESSSQPDDTLS